MAGSGAGSRESQTIRDLVLPALAASGWQDEQIRCEYFLRATTVTSPGGVGRALDAGFADIVLEATPGTPAAVVEAKREYRTAADAIQQAIKYAQQLDVPLAYGANGRSILERNMRTGVEREVAAFAAPALAWDEYCQLHGINAVDAGLLAQPFNRNRTNAHGDVIEPRPYQVVAVNCVLGAIARGERRVLLLMATGTGKTFTAMQIVAKLRSYAAATRPDRNYRVLYLADRTALLDQPMRRDFIPAFGSDPVHRVLGATDRSREIYFSTYHSMAGEGDDELQRLLEFRPDWFDLVVVDECHRGSANENSRWREVLEHFSPAVQLGLTATPRDDTVKSYEYFGNPVFEYSLRRGIEDGYLAPYRVRRVVLSPDADGWRPAPDQLDRFRREVPDDIYTTRDFERVVSLLARTRLAARHLSRVLRSHPNPRAIVFCVDIEHAAEMRSALAQENPGALRDDPEWVVRIVGTEHERERLLEDFCDPTRSSPVVATTSRMLSTGIDVEDLTHVVLFRPVGSMIEFKQIVGRGSRLYPDKGKLGFEVVDYVGASSKFNDPDFDGYPAHIITETVDDSGETVETTDVAPGIDPVDEEPLTPHVAEPTPPFCPEVGPEPDPRQIRRKYYIDEGNFTVESESILVADTRSGRLQLTEIGALARDRIRAVGDADKLRRTWMRADSRLALRQALEEAGIELDEIVALAGGGGVDPLDALHHLAWDLPVRTRAERARRVREQYFAEIEHRSAQAREILEGLLIRYERHGVEDLETTQVFRLEPFAELGSVKDLADALGGPEQLRAQLDLVQEWLYSA